jgi:hypothetical protein
MSCSTQFENSMLLLTEKPADLENSSNFALKLLVQTCWMLHAGKPEKPFGRVLIAKQNASALQLSREKEQGDWWSCKLVWILLHWLEHMILSDMHNLTQSPSGCHTMKQNLKKAHWWKRKSKLSAASSPASHACLLGKARSLLRPGGWHGQFSAKPWWFQDNHGTFFLPADVKKLCGAGLVLPEEAKSHANVLCRRTWCLYPEMRKDTKSSIFDPDPLTVTTRQCFFGKVIFDRDVQFKHSLQGDASNIVVGGCFLFWRIVK